MTSLINPVDHNNRYQVRDDDQQREPQEYTPLLPRPRPSRSRTFAPIFIIVMLLMVLSGVIIGIYLLIEQDREWPITFPFDMVFKPYWGAAKPLRSENQLAQIPTPYIVLSHTGTDKCFTFSMCCQVLIKMQYKYQHQPYNMSDIPFNFLIGSDGETYEGRGFRIVGNIDPEFDNQSISLGLIGNFSEESPPPNQLSEITSFIIESIRRNKISPSYRIIARAFEGEPKALYDIISKWKHFSQI